MNYYIASCVFTSKYPELSYIIQNYVAKNTNLSIVRCCVPEWKKQIYEDKMPKGFLSDKWKTLPQSHIFDTNDSIWSLCPNCMNISEEWRHVKDVHSLWELIDQDKNFPFPDYSGIRVTIQDCWRMKERTATHKAVRSLLKKMNIEFIEISANREKANFCGLTLYKPQVSRNPKLAPKHYKENAKGLFIPHTTQQQIQIMNDYCKVYQTDIVVCYCHYCLEGLLAGGVNGIHLAELLFKNYDIKAK